MRYTTIDNTADVIDSRDIIERIATLKRQSELDEAGLEVGLDADECAELVALETLQEEAEGYAPDWQHGVTLIHDSYFTDYCAEMLEDCGDIPKNLPRYVVIDWNATARNIRYDYTAVDFDGVTYWVR